uniref:ER membrane protein complex subunit 7 beta-sandwich domain-containing protein n=1 Tax=Ditylenchus dipsaci TaxID=166011 RepID=A0A915CPC3_9BILA
MKPDQSVYFLLCIILAVLTPLSGTSASEAVVTGGVDQSQPNSSEAEQLFSVQGKAMLRHDMHAPPNWRANSRVLLDYGKHIGFIREDGNFVVDGVPSGSYILEITNTDYIFEPVRIDITSKGKIRARRLNLLQPNTVNTIAYPLQLTARQPAKYFRAREEWRITDVLMNPMVIMLQSGYA